MQEVSFLSEGDRLTAALFLPEQTPAPAIIFAHGVFEFKEDFFDYAGRLTEAGFVALAPDMRGHGASEGVRYSCDQDQWAADVVSAMDYLETRPEVEQGRFLLPCCSTSRRVQSTALGCLEELCILTKNRFKSAMYLGQSLNYLTGLFHARKLASEKSHVVLY